MAQCVGKLEVEIETEVTTREVDVIFAHAGRVDIVSDPEVKGNIRIYIDGQEITHLRSFRLEWAFDDILKLTTDQVVDARVVAR